MAQGQGSYSRVPNGQDTFGGHLFGVLDYNGPSSYVTGGDGPIDPKAFGFENTILSLWGSLDNTDQYLALGVPLQKGTTSWLVFWFSFTGQEAEAGTDLSGITVRLSAIGY